MRYRLRGSHKGADTIAAIQFNGFQELPTDARRKRPVVPDWLPDISLVVTAEDGVYEGDDIDPTPAGEVWSMGNIFARFGLSDGHRDCHAGDFICRFPDGTVMPMKKADFHRTYRGV